MFEVTPKPSIGIKANTTAMGIVTIGIDQLMTTILPGAQLVLRAVRLFTSIGGGLVALAASAKILHIDEFDDALQFLGASTAKRGAA